MANTRTQRRENELPYIPFGPFQIRLPFIHYKIESVEFIQGLILGVTALAAVPYLEQYLGLPYELAWSCVIPLSASQSAWRSGSTGVDHTDPAADYCISGRLPHGKRANTGYDRTADAGRSGIYLYGCDQTGG